MAVAGEHPGSVGFRHLEELRSELRSELAAGVEAVERRLLERLGGGGKASSAGGPGGTGGDDEDTRADSFAPHGSVWDACLVASVRGTPCDFALHLATLALTLAVQLGFCYIISRTSMTVPPLKEGTLKELAVWRMSFGHSIEQYDALTNTSLVSRVCRNAAFGTNANNQKSLFQVLTKYDTLTQVLFALTVFLWTYEIVCDLFSSYDFLRAVLSVPKGDKSRLDSDGGTFSYVSMSRKHALGLVLGVVLPKVVIACWLGLLGVQYLSFSLEPKTLILDAIALKFVFDLDERLYDWLVPSRIRRSVDSLRPIPITRLTGPVRLGQRLPVREISALLSVLVAVAVIVPASLVPVTDLTTRAGQILCGGNQDFVYATDSATGVVAVTDTAAFDVGDSGPMFGSYAFRAVQRKIDIDLGALLEEGAVGPGAPEPGKIYIDSTIAVLRGLSVQDFGMAVDSYQCRDSVEASGTGTNVSMQQALAAKFAGAAYCSNLTQQDCSTPEGRAFCPTTCLCDDAWTGILDRRGCSVHCSTDLEGDFRWWVRFLTMSDICRDEGDKAEEFAGYFAEAQTLFVDRGWLVLSETGVYYPEVDIIFEFAYSHFFSVGISPVANFTLSEWAMETYLNGSSTGNSTPCKFISFVYRMFHFDACEAELLPTGERAGSLKSLCPETCGYCDTPRSAGYRSASYPDLADWLLGAGVDLLQPLNGSEVCAWWLDERWGDRRAYWRDFLHEWCDGGEGYGNEGHGGDAQDP